MHSNHRYITRLVWIKFLVLLVCFGSSVRLHAQPQRYPANVSTILNAPNSLYLEDYSDPAKNLLLANIVFNDFNEPSWSFRLKLTIESKDVRLATRSGFVPANPIVVQPGILTQFSSSDWATYFDFNNLDISGSGANLVRQEGRLPEGLYSFCIEVLDYQTGDPLSRETCTSVWIQLNDPPRIISPFCGTTIDPKLASFPFQWQLFNTQSPNTQGTSYELTIWQLTDPEADPMVAVPNGQALQVFQSEELSSTSLVYGPTKPLLDVGKTYVYQVQAKSLDGRDSFKNGGKSEFCYFHYGWSEGGTIELSWPEYDGGFRSEEQPYLTWKAPQNKQANQGVAYFVEVVEMKEGQTPEEAYRSNDTWVSYRKPPVYDSYGGSTNLPPLRKATKYAWKVTAYTGEQKVAESSVGLLNGPGLVEFFYAGNHRVDVDYVNGTDVTSISGEGKVRVTPRIDIWTDLKFEDITLIDNGGFWVMNGGTIEIPVLGGKRIIDIKPFYHDNQPATYEIEKYRLTKDGLDAYGVFYWDFPHATLSSEKPIVHSVEHWANFNNFKINTVVALPENANRFDLLEPYKFTLDLYESSLVYINDDRFRFELDGDLFAPEEVRRQEKTRASFRFDDAPDLFYIYSKPDAFANAIQPIPNTQYWLRSSNYILDLSEKKSPGIHAGALDWKGVDMIDYSLTYEQSPDNKGQLKFDTPYRQSYTQDAEARYAYVTTQGLSLKLNTAYADIGETLKFQTFLSSSLAVDLLVEDNTVDDKSLLKGNFLIPFVSLEKRFGYEIPITNLGVQKGFLTDLEGTKFTHNKNSGDQEIFVTIRRAVLSGNERITMTLDLEWPGLDVKLTALRDFKVWGDYSVGFSTKNGTVALENRINALMGTEKYPVTIDIIGAGSYNGNYMFATTADVVLGEDVSGPEDAPTINVYSAVANPYVPKEANGTIGELPGEGPTPQQAYAQVKEEMQAVEESLLEKLSEGSEQLAADAQTLQASMGGQGTIFTPEDIVSNNAQETYRKASTRYEALLQNIISDLSMGLLAPLDEKVDSLNSTIQRKIQQPVDQAKVKIAALVDQLVDNVASRLTSTLQNDKVDVAPLVNDVAQVTRQSLKAELTSSLDQSVQNNLLIPIETLLKDQVLGEIHNYIAEEGSKLSNRVIAGETAGVGDFAKGFPKAIGKALQNVMNFVSLDNLESTVVALGEDLVKNIDMAGVAAEIRGHVGNKVKDALAALAGDMVSDLASDFAKEVGLPAFAGGEHGIDFVGVGGKLAQGDYKGAIKDAFLVDPVPLNMVTPIVELTGMVNYTPDDPVYGDVWSGDIDMRVKVPKPFILNATYINGRVGDNSYWFVEIRGNEEQQSGQANKSYKLGDPIAKEAKPLANPVNMGIANLVGVSGRLYHHMSETSNGGIVPDPNMRFGAFMNVVFFDKKNGGQNMRLAVAGEINTKENGDYTLAFLGDLQLRSTKVDVVTPDESAAVQGTVEIKYNSAERHFFGYAKVKLFKPGVICAEGSLLVDTKPGKWRVALGNMDDRIRFVPGCVGWSPTGWLDVNESVAELGLGVEFSIAAKTPTIKLFVVKFNFAAEAGLAAGILAAVRYRPSFAVVKAGVWAELYARLVMNYKFKLKKWKTLTLLEIALAGDMIMYFIPDKVLEGKLRGRVKVLFFSTNVNAHLRKEL